MEFGHQFRPSVVMPDGVSITGESRIRSKSASSGPRFRPPPSAVAAGPPKGEADWKKDVPGRRHRVDLTTLPAPYDTSSAARFPRFIDPPAGRPRRGVYLGRAVDRRLRLSAQLAKRIGLGWRGGQSSRSAHRPRL
jgi:hypothetical protein